MTVVTLRVAEIYNDTEISHEPVLLDCRILCSQLCRANIGAIAKASHSIYFATHSIYFATHSIASTDKAFSAAFTTIPTPSLLPAHCALQHAATPLTVYSY